MHRILKDYREYKAVQLRVLRGGRFFEHEQIIVRKTQCDRLTTLRQIAIRIVEYVERDDGILQIILA